MLSSLRGFLTRHRRKFIVTGVVVGGTYLIFKYAQHKLIAMQERQAREFLEKSRRAQHFESTEKTCNQVIIGMSSELCAAVIRLCSTDELLEQLRQNPDNRLELWEEMKIVAFTRLTTYIYAISMLVVTLRVQMNLLGGYLYKDITTEKQQISDETKQYYLSLIRHFIHEGGLSELVQFIRTKVSSIFKTLPLNKRLTLPDLEHLFYSLQMSINSDANDPNSKMAKFMLPAQLPEYNGNVPLLQKMFNETLDLLESDDASVVCSQSICRGFSLAIDAFAESMGETLRLTAIRNAAATATTKSEDASDAQVPDKTSNDNNNAVLNINNVEVALAKIIPIVSGLTSKGFDSSGRPQNLATSLVTFYIVAEKTKMFGANVYESFCT